MNLPFNSTRRNFISLAGKGLDLAALSSSTIASLLAEVQAATKSVAHLTLEPGNEHSARFRRADRARIHSCRRTF